MAASAPVTWEALSDVMVRGMDGLPRALRQVLALEPPAASGPRPLERHSALPGFRVVNAQRGSRLTLSGQHRFSRYQLDFLLSEDRAGCVIRARSYAAFPGLQGAVYRTLLMRTGGHDLAVRHILNRTAHKAVRNPQAVAERASGLR